ncbi:MAG: hypothetical protein ACP5I3_00450 [Thermoproteus sp.]
MKNRISVDARIWIAVVALIVVLFFAIAVKVQRPANAPTANWALKQAETSGVPTPRVCIIGFPNSSYIGALVKGLREINISYVIGEANPICDILVVQDSLAPSSGMLGFLKSGKPVVVAGPHASKALLDAAESYIAQHAAVLIVGDVGPDKTARLLLPSGASAIGLFMLPSRNSTRYITGWDIFADMPLESMAYAVLRTWIDYYHTIVTPRSTYAFDVLNLQTVTSPTGSSATSVIVQITGLNYVGYVGWYQSNFTDLYGNLGGQQWLRIDFYYTYQSSPTYWWFVNVVKHYVEAYPVLVSLGFTPYEATETVNMYTNQWPGQVYWDGAPINPGSIPPNPTIYQLSVGPPGAQVSVTESVYRGQISWGTTGDPAAGIMTWMWTFSNASLGYSYEVVPISVVLLDPNKLGGVPPAVESFSTTAYFCNVFYCGNAAPTISLKVLVYTTSVQVVSTSTS